jgi:hypothetical protein
MALHEAALNAAQKLHDEFQNSRVYDRLKENPPSKEEDWIPITDWMKKYCYRPNINHKNGDISKWDEPWEKVKVLMFAKCKDCVDPVHTDMSAILDVLTTVKASADMYGNKDLFSDVGLHDFHAVSNVT